MTAWRIVHLDIAEGIVPVDAGGAAALVVFWWRGLPLGYRAFEAAESPVRASLLVALAADMVAAQARARSPALGAPWRAGEDATPIAGPSLAMAEPETPVLELLDRWAAEPAPDARQLSVVVCTRDRPQMLRACLAGLAAQARPPREVIVVDNSPAGSAKPVATGLSGVRYVHEPKPGLSRARNAGVAAASGEFVAFTDDDVTLSTEWTAEVVRAFADPTVDAMTGLVLPASLDTPAQRAFQLELGGFTERFQPLRFDALFLERTRAMGPQVWRVGAGANMAFRRRVFAELGGFDERLGAGASGCSEDSEYWYRMLAAGGVCLYEPRAYVFHHHRAEWAALRRQYRHYMRGHVSALVVQADRYGPSGDLRRIFTQLPSYFAWTGLRAVQTLSWWRLALLAHEVAGWASGLFYLARPGWRRRRSERRPHGATTGANAKPKVVGHA